MFVLLTACFITKNRTHLAMIFLLYLRMNASAVYVNRLVLVRVEKEDKSEVFKYLWHMFKVLIRGAKLRIIFDITKFFSEKMKISSDFYGADIKCRHKRRKIRGRAERGWNSRI